jgi:EAL domain-containing protein (putative c-di-GMP-specific phosphodiesterase class I)
VKTIMTLASELRIGVTAEGVESERQQEQLLSLGCQYAQGYLYSKPLGTTAAEQFLSENINARTSGFFPTRIPRSKDSEVIEAPYPV